MADLNRKQRRAAKAAARHGRPHEIVRVHEAGHCVARVLTASLLGWKIHEVINYIDIPFSPEGPRNAEATTYGRFNSKPMEEFLHARMPDKIKPGNSISNADLLTLALEMRAAGIDLVSWFRAKSVQAIFGPMAEARLLNKPFEEVWGANTSDGDGMDVVRAGFMCGMTADEISSQTGAAERVVEYLMTNRPELWQAILAAADILKFGRNDGREIADAIVTTLLKYGPVPQLNFGPEAFSMFEEESLATVAS